MPTRQELIRKYDERQAEWDVARKADPEHNQADLPLNTTPSETLLLDLLKQADAEIEGTHDNH